jgi:RimJ/RimL family protein N-acetyltransferase
LTEARPPAVTLEGRFVTLEPMAERHKEDLRAACEADPEIWDLYPYSMAGEHFEPYWVRTQKALAAGQMLPFAVMAGGRCQGVSCMFLDPPNHSLEIGGTYYHPALRGTAVNPESKRLLMAHAFDHGIARVGYRVDALNARSRAAMLKLGAVQEGIIRADRITWTGRTRDTVNFSVLAVEWPAVREWLDARLAAFG